MRRYLGPNSRSSAPNLYCAFDTETYPTANPHVAGEEVNLLKLGVACFWRLEGGKVRSEEWFEWTDNRKFWAWLEQRTQPRKRCFVFAHNLIFDLTAAQFWARVESKAWRPFYRRPPPPGQVEGLTDRREESACWVLEDPPTVLDCVTPEGHRATFLDLMNYKPMALSKVAAELGLPQSEELGDESPLEGWWRRCRNDVAIVKSAVCNLVDFCKRDNLGNFRYTTSAQSMALYRHRCHDREIVVGHPEEVRKEERLAYYGGRCRAYYLGRCVEPQLDLFGGAVLSGPTQASCRTGPVYVLDVNSQYPFAMHRESYPISYLHTDGPQELFDFESKFGGLEACALVTVVTCEEPFPVRVDGQVQWFTGRFPCWLCGGDLEHALSRDLIAAVHQVHWYKRGRPFVGFCEEVWKLQEKYAGDDGKFRRSLAKVYGVALHGKFGQKSIRWELVKDEVPLQPWGAYFKLDLDDGSVETWRGLGDNGQRKLPVGESEGNFPLLAACVASHARNLMRKFRRVAGKRNVFYEDADTLHVSHEGYLNLKACGCLDPVKPGFLKVERVVKEAQWRGPRNYCLEGVWTTVGITPRTRIDPKGLCHETRFQQAASLLGGPPPAGPVTREITFIRPDPQQMGRVGPDGWVDWPLYSE